MSSARLSQITSLLPSGTHLLAVSKGHPALSIRSLAEIGQCDFGESRLQEAIPKLQALKDLKSIRWHFIGRLQANKVRSVVKSFEFIHSVDSLRLAERISRISGEEQCFPKTMLQVKFRDDPLKGGFAPQQLTGDWSKLMQLPHLKIVGLMTMAPKNFNLDDRINLFSDCRALANQLHLPDCSMGMSDDWKEALQCGSTWLRLGKTLFGERINHVNSHTDITKSG